MENQKIRQGATHKLALMKVKFSIITPVLNGLSDIEGYVKCLEDQTYSNWEAIIVDDGSIDGTVERLQELTSFDQRFKILTNTLQRAIRSPYQARNVGIDMACGSFICFLDIDDRWTRTKLECQAFLLNEDPNLKLIYSSYIRTKQGTAVGRTRHALPLLKPHQLVKIVNPVPMLTSCVQKDLIKDIKFEAIHHEDFIFWRNVIKHLKPSQILVENTPRGIYAIHPNSISSNKARAVFWIWICYRHMGYNLPKSILALLTRGVLQVIMAIQSFLQPKILLETLE